MKRTYQENFQGSPTTGNTSFPMGKAKMWEDTPDDHRDAGEDELLAMLGYKVRSSDMADVAQKLEHLEMMMGVSSSNQEDVLVNHLGGSDTVHYNPSDLPTWLQSILCEAELNSLPPSFDKSSQIQSLNNPFIAPAESSTITTVGFPNSICQPLGCDDLSAIPGEAIIYGERDRKRMRPDNLGIGVGVGVGIEGMGGTGGIEVDTESARPIVLVDSQENGIRLVHTLMACAEAVEQDNLKLAESLVKEVSLLAALQQGAMRKVATYFAEALARRIYGLYPQAALDQFFADILLIHFYETCPHLKFAHFMSNQAILDGVVDCNRVHIVDFSIKQGVQWPALMQALSRRDGGPPSLRITGIGPPQAEHADNLQEVGWKLAQFADNLHIEFEYRGFVANSLSDLEAAMVDVRPGETVVVNSAFDLHPLLAIPGAIEKVLGSIKEMKPKIITMVEQEANHNEPGFLDRFTEALHYYSTIFDSFEGYALSPSTGQDLLMLEMFFGRQICNVVACEGLDRTERHECLTQWKTRFESAGFYLTPLGSNTFKQVNSLLGMFGGGAGYRVDEKNGCLMLGWHNRPLVSASVWQLASDDNSD